MKGKSRIFYNFNFIFFIIHIEKSQNKSHFNDISQVIQISPDLAACHTYDTHALLLTFTRNIRSTILKKRKEINKEETAVLKEDRTKFSVFLPP